MNALVLQLLGKLSADGLQLAAIFGGLSWQRKRPHSKPLVFQRTGHISDLATSVG